MRDNILFGKPYDEQRYSVAVQAAQLETDLAMLPAGDMTELGGLCRCLPGCSVLLSAFVQAFTKAA